MHCRQTRRRPASVLCKPAWFGLVWSLLLGTACGQQQPPNNMTGPVPGPARQCGLECVGRIRPRTSDQIGGSPWGVSCHWIADKHELSVEQQLDRLAWLGAKWAFLCPDWDRIETEKDHYHWNGPAHRLDDVVAGLIKRGIAPVMQIYGGNRLYMPFVPDPNNRPLADAAMLLDDPGCSRGMAPFPGGDGRPLS